MPGRTTVRLPARLAQRLKRYAAREGISLDEALARALDDFEETLKREQAAEAVIKLLGLEGSAKPSSKLAREKRARKRAAAKRSTRKKSTRRLAS